MSRRRAMPPLAAANLALAFLLELAALVGFALLAALVPDGWPRFAAGIAAVAVLVVLWAMFAAPRAKRRLKMPALLIFKLAVFVVAAVGFVAAGQMAWAAVFVVLCAVNFAGMAWFRQF